MLFHFVDKKVRINHTIKVQDFISEIFQKEKISFRRIDYIFCSDNYLLPINKKFLHHNYYTDTISFTMNDDPLIGEIYISLDRIKDNSKKYKVLLGQEMLRVMFHGALHLCGYSDKTEKDIELMRFKENIYLELFNEGT
ncbi:MAG: rRNA maturation RNase YbeY [Ginsengibacter sp.]